MQEVATKCIVRSLQKLFLENIKSDVFPDLELKLFVHLVSLLSCAFAKLKISLSVESLSLGFYSVNYWFGLVCFLPKKLLLYTTIALNVNGARMQKFHSMFYFLIWVFFWRHCRSTGQKGQGRDHIYSFLSTSSTRSQTFRHFFVALHLVLLSSIFL